MPEQMQSRTNTKRHNDTGQSSGFRLPRATAGSRTSQFATCDHTGTHARSKIVFVGRSVLKTALTDMPIFGSPSLR